MIRGGIKIIGDTKAINALATKGALNGEIAAALYQSAEIIMTDSKKNYVPVDTGDLMRSGTVFEPKIDTAGTISVSLGYGTHYAKIVHDRPPSIGQGKIKYLEKPFLAHMKTAEKLLVQHVSRAIQTIRKTKRSTYRDLWRKYQDTSTQGNRVNSGTP
jgi:hypothetical protein